MKIEIFSVYDIKGESFGTPFFLARKEMAVREFGDLVNDPKSRIYAHAEDYQLFHVGSFDVLNGKVENNGKDRFIVNASNLKKNGLLEVSK